MDSVPFPVSPCEKRFAEELSGRAQTPGRQGKEKRESKTDPNAERHIDERRSKGESREDARAG